MEEKIVWRCRTPGPLEIRVEVLQRGDALFYRRLFEQDLVMEAPIDAHKAGQLFFTLLEQGWHTE